MAGHDRPASRRARSVGSRRRILESTANCWRARLEMTLLAISAQRPSSWWSSQSSAPPGRAGLPGVDAGSSRRPRPRPCRRRWICPMACRQSRCCTSPTRRRRVAAIGSDHRAARGSPLDQRLRLQHETGGLRQDLPHTATNPRPGVGEEASSSWGSHWPSTAPSTARSCTGSTACG